MDVRPARRYRIEWECERKATPAVVGKLCYRGFVFSPSGAAFFAISARRFFDSFLPSLPTLDADHPEPRPRSVALASLRLLRPPPAGRNLFTPLGLRFSTSAPGKG